jgi:hypothetical protein
MDTTSNGGDEALRRLPRVRAPRAAFVSRCRVVFDSAS